MGQKQAGRSSQRRQGGWRAGVHEAGTRGAPGGACWAGVEPRARGTRFGGFVVLAARCRPGREGDHTTSTRARAPPGEAGAAPTREEGRSRSKAIVPRTATGAPPPPVGVPPARGCCYSRDLYAAQGRGAQTLLSLSATTTPGAQPTQPTRAAGPAGRPGRRHSLDGHPSLVLDMRQTTVRAGRPAMGGTLRRGAAAPGAEWAARQRAQPRAPRPRRRSGARRAAVLATERTLRTPPRVASASGSKKDAARASRAAADP